MTAYFTRFPLLLSFSALLAVPLLAQGDCPVDGGTISLTNGSDSLAICAGDGMSDAFDVILDGETGDSSIWVITDADLNILGLPALPPFDLEGAGDGTCLIWHLAYDESLTGASVGANAGDLGGCFSLSNPITVTRYAGDACAQNLVEGGSIALADGSFDASICSDGTGDPLTVIHDGNATGPNRTFVITDDAGMILGIPGNDGPFDLDGAGAGTCLIWYLAHADGLTGLMMGTNVDQLEGTFSFSNPITVRRYTEDCANRVVSGGSISLTLSGGVDTSICVDNVADPLMVTRDGTASGTNRTFVITDDDGMILGIPGNDGPFNLDPAGPGTCLIWYLAYADGISGLMMGASVDSLVGAHDFSNPITVVRQSPDGGRVTTAGGMTTFTAVAGDVRVPVAFRTTATELSYWYVITDEDDNILDFANARSTDTLDLSGAPAGTCRIWGWSYRGLSDPIMGENISTLTNDSCEAVSANFIEVIRTDSTTSTFEPLDADLVMTFPNPVTHTLHVEVRDLEGPTTIIELFSSTGQRLHLRAAALASGRQDIVMDQLPRGVYLLRVTNGGKSLTRRIARL
jgi:hypothetical protein